MAVAWTPLQLPPVCASPVGEREGHNCVVLSVPAGSDASEGREPAVLLFGGVVEGEHDDELHLLRVRRESDGDVPRGAWTSLGRRGVAEREGFGLVRCGPASALVVCGLTSDVEMTNDVHRIDLVPRTGADDEACPDDDDDDSTELAVRATVTLVAATGAAPSPRARVSAAWTGSVVVVFGGEDDDGKQLADAAAFDPATGVWRTLSVPAAAPAPSGRFSATALPLGADCDGRMRVLVAGGAFFPQPGAQASLDDAWVLTVGGDGTALWTAAPAGTIPVRFNGGCGAVLAASCVALFGGKDQAEGCDDVLLLDAGASGPLQLLRQLPPCDPALCPHWRYTGAGCVVQLADRSAWLLALGGQCRHPDPVDTYVAAVPAV